MRTDLPARRNPVREGFRQKAGVLATVGTKAPSEQAPFRKAEKHVTAVKERSVRQQGRYVRPETGFCRETMSRTWNSGVQKEGKRTTIARRIGTVAIIMMVIAMAVIMTMGISATRYTITNIFEQQCETDTKLLEYELSMLPADTDINEALDDLKSRMGCDFSIFVNGKRMYTTMMENGRRATGASLPEAAAETVEVKGEQYMGEVDLQGHTYLLCYRPMTRDGVNYVLSAARSIEVVDESTQSTILFSSLIAVAAVVIFSLILTRYLKKYVSAPLAEITQVATRLENGDLGIKSQEDLIIQANSNDEVGALASAFRNTTDRLKSYIGEISSTLNSIADGDLTIQASGQYVGDFESIQKSMEGIEAKLNRTLLQIRTSAGQVSAGASQVANSAQSLAQGTTEQASTVSALADTVNAIADSADDTARATSEADRLVNEAGEQLQTSVGYVNKLNEAMKGISESSDQISKIISSIESIAFQTNLLALNAAVEAARAGAAGRGFAVVADEVRNLATRSDEAAKATKELIENSLVSVGEGSEAVTNVTASLTKTAESAGSVSEHMATVVEAVHDQTEAIASVREGIDQISDVVQQEAATSEESAAASQQLSGQADLLNQLVGNFKLDDKHEPYGVSSATPYGHGH